MSNRQNQDQNNWLIEETEEEDSSSITEQEDSEIKNDEI